MDFWDSVLFSSNVTRCVHRHAPRPIYITPTGNGANIHLDIPFAESNKVFCLWPWKLMCAGTMHDTMTGLTYQFINRSNLKLFRVCDWHISFCYFSLSSFHNFSKRLINGNWSTFGKISMLANTFCFSWKTSKWNKKNF